MNDESDNFEALRKLLALKRYEQPPPGYFNQLPGRIIMRLDDIEPTFFEKLAQMFVFRPAMAYALGLAFCGAFTSSLVYSLRSGQVAQLPNPGERWDVANSANALASRDGLEQFPTLHARGFNNFVFTNDEAPKPSLFHEIQVRPARVNYNFGQ